MSAERGARLDRLEPLAATATARARTALGHTAGLGDVISGLPPGRRARAGAAVVAVALIELVLAAAVVDSRFRLLLLPLVTVAGLALAYVAPLVTSGVFVALTSTIVEPARFQLGLGGFSVTASELVLVALLVVAVTRPRRKTFGGPAGRALAAFLAILLVATIAAMSSGRVSLHDALDSARGFFSLAFFWVVVRLFPEPDRVRRLLALSVALAALSGIVGLILFLNNSTDSPLQGYGNILTFEPGVESQVRVRLPALALSYGLFWYAVTQALGGGRRRLLWAVSIPLLLILIGISFNRNMWLGLVFGLAVVIVVAARRTRARLTIALALVVTTILLGVISGTTAVRSEGALAPVVKRGSTLLSPNREVSQDESVRDRERESRAAWQRVRERPLLGNGPGAPVGVLWQAPLGTSKTATVVTQQRFVHNQYLYLLFIGGIGLLVTFLAFLVVTLRDAWRARERSGVFGALFAGIAMTMLSSVVMLYFSETWFVVMLAMVGGAVHVFSRAPDAAPAGPPRRGRR